MAHCINCDVLISDRPDHGDYCSEECETEYRQGADAQRLEASKVNDNFNAPSENDSVNDKVNAPTKPTDS